MADDQRDIRKIMVSPAASILETMRVVEAAGIKEVATGIALVVGEDERLLGIATDGDIRRAVLKGIDLNRPIAEVMNPEPITVKEGLSPLEMYQVIQEEARASTRLRQPRVDRVIVLDGQGRVRDVISFVQLCQNLGVQSKTVTVVGLGYVGLTLALSLADAGLHVVGIEANPQVVDQLRRGQSHVHESGLAPLLQYHLNTRFVVDRDLGRYESEIYILCVGTPIGEDDKPGLEDLCQACRMVGRVLRRRDLVILRSTVPVGTSRDLVLPLLEAESGLKGGRDFSLAFAPERTVEGQALEELRRLPQIVGGLDKTSVELTLKLFKELTPSTIVVESLEAAEIIKLINNSFRDLIFAFANEFSLICDRLNLDTARLIDAANEGYPRDKIPRPSPGVGGACLSKDPYLYVESSRRCGVPSRLARLGREINESIPSHIASKVVRFIEQLPPANEPVKILIMGLAFKGRPDTSDLRGSPSLDLIKALAPHGDLYGYDPVVPPSEVGLHGVKPCSLEEGFRDARCVVLMTNHNSYEGLDLFPLLQGMRRPGLFVDCWHLFFKEEVERVAGIRYDGLGVSRGGEAPRV